MLIMKKAIYLLHLFTYFVSLTAKQQLTVTVCVDSILSFLLTVTDTQLGLLIKAKSNTQHSAGGSHANVDVDKNDLFQFPSVHICNQINSPLFCSHYVPIP